MQQRRRISWAAERLSASQEILCFVEWVRQICCLLFQYRMCPLWLCIINARYREFHCALEPITADAHNQELGVETEITFPDVPVPVPIYISFTLIKSELSPCMEYWLLPWFRPYLKAGSAVGKCWHPPKNHPVIKAESKFRSLNAPI